MLKVDGVYENIYSKFNELWLVYFCCTGLLPKLLKKSSELILLFELEDELEGFWNTSLLLWLFCEKLPPHS